MARNLTRRQIGGLKKYDDLALRWAARSSGIACGSSRPFRSGDNQQLQQGNYYNKRQGTLFYEPDLTSRRIPTVVEGPHPAPDGADRVRSKDRRRDLDAAELQLLLQPAGADRGCAVGAGGQRAAPLQPPGQHNFSWRYPATTALSR